MLSSRTMITSEKTVNKAKKDERFIGNYCILSLKFDIVLREREKNMSTRTLLSFLTSRIKSYLETKTKENFHCI